MRLIDADTLNLEYEVEMADDWKTAHEIANVIKYAPTVDAVEVVRCRECKWCSGKYFDGSQRKNRLCRVFNRYVEADDYCSHGIRKELADVPLP